MKFQRTNFLPKQLKHWCRKLGIIIIGRNSRRLHVVYKEYVVTFSSDNNEVEVVFYDKNFDYFEVQLTYVLKNFDEFRRFIERCENQIRFRSL